jgi:hypothetical protein
MSFLYNKLIFICWKSTINDKDLFNLRTIFFDLFRVIDWYNLVTIAIPIGIGIRLLIVSLSHSLFFLINYLLWKHFYLSLDFWLLYLYLQLFFCHVQQATVTTEYDYAPWRAWLLQVPADACETVFSFWWKRPNPPLVCYHMIFVTADVDGNI